MVLCVHVVMEAGRYLSLPYQIEEMVDLRERLQHSHGFLGVCVDKLMLDFLMQVTR